VAGGGEGRLVAASSGPEAATSAAAATTAAVDLRCAPVHQLGAAPPFLDLRCEALRQGIGYACARRGGGRALGRCAQGRRVLPLPSQLTTHLTARWFCALEGWICRCEHGALPPGFWRSQPHALPTAKCMLRPAPSVCFARCHAWHAFRVSLDARSGPFYVQKVTARPSRALLRQTATFGSAPEAPLLVQPLVGSTQEGGL
jgi:hypothetical protein